APFFRLGFLSSKLFGHEWMAKGEGGLQALRRLIAASEAGAVEEAQRSFEELRQVVPSGRFAKPFLWNLVLKERQRVPDRKKVKARDFPAAEAWFQRLCASRLQPSARSFGKLLAAASAAPHRAEAYFWEGLRHTEPDMAWYGALLDGWAKVDPGRASAWFKRLKEVEVDPRCLKSVAVSLATQGDNEEALAWLEGVEEAELLRVTLAATAEDAEGALRKMEEAGTADLRAYTSAIRAFARQSDAEGARRWLRASAGADAVSFTAAIAGFARRGQLAPAMLLLAEMLEAGLAPGVGTWTAMLGALAQRGDAAAARRWLQEMQNAQLRPDEAALGAVISSSSRAGQADEALQMLRAMRSAEQAPGVVSYTAVIAGFARQARVEEAQGLLGEMRQLGRGAQ
ncbi:unnamed protein product, partial [Effrenium voratum]